MQAHHEIALTYTHKMAEAGDPRFSNRVRDLMATADEFAAEAGRYGQYCDITMATYHKMVVEIQENEDAARDRFDDLTSDMFD